MQAQLDYYTDQVDLANLTVTVMAQGRVVSGPAGASGAVTLPIRVAATDGSKTLYSNLSKFSVTIPPEGTAQYTSDLTGVLAKYEVDPYGGEIKPRAPINDTVECLFIGGGFSALLTSARLREYGVESIRIVERGADVAVRRFLDGSLSFGDIPRLLEAAVERFGGTAHPAPDVEGLIALDAEVRAAFASGPVGASA